MFVKHNTYDRPPTLKRIIWSNSAEVEQLCFRSAFVVLLSLCTYLLCLPHGILFIRTMFLPLDYASWRARFYILTYRTSQGLFTLKIAFVDVISKFLLPIILAVLETIISHLHFRVNETWLGFFFFF